MNCIKFEELAMQYFDSTATKEQIDEMEEHFKDCSSCKESFEAMKKVIDMLEEPEEINIDGKFTADVMDKVTAYEECRVNTQRLLEKIIYPISAAFVLTGIFFWMYVINNVNLAVVLYRLMTFAKVLVYSILATLMSSGLIEYASFLNSQLHLLIPLALVIVGIYISSDSYNGKKENNI